MDCGRPDASLAMMRTPGLDCRWSWFCAGSPDGRRLPRVGPGPGAEGNTCAVAIDAHLHGELGSQPFDPAEIALRMLEVATVTAGMINPLIDHYASVEDWQMRAGSV